jgi:hypothetical protein
MKYMVELGGVLMVGAGAYYSRMKRKIEFTTESQSAQSTEQKI